MKEPSADTHNREATEFSRKKFDLRLQTIRGLAALVVAFHHCFNVFPFPPLSARVLRGVEGVFSGQTAVVTFFVLSGYVLGLSLTRSPTLTIRDYLQFMIKRVCRIMVPLWFLVLAFSVLISGLLWVTTGQTYIDGESWAQPTLLGSTYYRVFNPGVLAANMFLVAHDLDSVTWTVTIEMVGSALIPVFFLINRMTLCRVPLLLTLMAISMASSTGGGTFWHYLYMFQLGLLIPFWAPGVFSFLQGRHLLIVSLLVALVLCAVNSHFGHIFYLLGVALSFLLGFVIFRDHSWLKFLDARIAVWLGKVSYSFYLIHWPVLWIICFISLRAPGVTGAHPILASVVVFFISVPIAALLADVSYNWIEIPAITLGKRLTGKPVHLAPK